MNAASRPSRPSTSPRTSPGPSPEGPPIRSLGWCTDVGPLVAELAASPDLWNQHTPRTEYGVHAQADDIWVRYNDWANWQGSLALLNREHVSVWYPAYHRLPSLPGVIEAARRHAGMGALGGIFITRLGPGRRILPHVDGGWHAETYTLKVALQLRGNADQAFCFEGHQLSAEPGELYYFDNSKLHWVYNMSDEDRMTLIITGLPEEGR